MIIYGTSTYFKRNATARVGVCTVCKQTATLTSYDARKGTHIYFIPLIFSARLRVTDECNRCRRRYEANLKKWEAARQLGISGALASFRAHPSPEGAVSVHAGMYEFRDIARAEQFRAEAEQTFPDNAVLLAGFAHTIDYFESPTAALPLYQRALRLRPDLPAAKIGVGKILMGQGRLDEAYNLLAFLGEPGAEHLFDIAPLERLAYAFQAKGRHQEALKILGTILERIPTAADHQHFRKALQASQKALAQSGIHAEPIVLPKKKFTIYDYLPRTRNGFQFMILVAIVCVICFVLGCLQLISVAGHRRLYLVNGYNTPAVVILANKVYTLPPHSANLVTVPEGNYTIQVTKPTQSVYTFNLVYDSIFGRLADSADTVFNVDGAGIIASEKIHYTPKDRPDIKIDPEVQYSYGSAFQVFNNIDYPFVQAPLEINLSNHEQDKVKWTLELIPPGDYESYLLSEKKVNDLLAFLEWHLTHEPDDAVSLGEYADRCQETDPARFKKFIAEHLSFDPVNVAWHRIYQDSADLNDKAAMRSRYDEELAKHPESSDLLYLRSRISLGLKEEQSFLNKSLLLNPNNPYALNADSYVCRIKGDWAGAETRLRKAAELKPELFESALYRVLLAEKKTKEVQDIFVSELKKTPYSLGLISSLMMCYEVEGDYSSVRACEKDAETRMLAAPDFPSKEAYLLQLQMSRDIDVHDWVSLEKEITPNDGFSLFLVRVVQNKWADIKASTIPAGISEDYISALLASTAARAAGENELADKLYQMAVDSVQKMGSEKQLLLSILKSPTPPARSDLDDLDLDSEFRVILLAALAYQHPEMKGEYCAEAQKLNTLPSLTYWILSPLIAQN